MNTFTTITADGRVMNWAEIVREEIDNEHHNPDAGIPFEVCDCPTLEEYKSIITLAA